MRSARNSFHRRHAALYLLGFLLTSIAANSALAQNRADAEKPETVGRWTAWWKNGGLFLDFDGIPVIQGGIVQVFSADGARGYYGSGSKPPLADKEKLPNGGLAYSARYEFQNEAGKFAAVQRVEITPDNRVTLTLRCNWSGKEAASLEWNAARLWAYPLVGATWTAHSGTAQTSGKISLKPLAANEFSPEGNRLVFANTAVGTVQWTAQNADSLKAFDSRSQTGDRRTLWLGMVGKTLAPATETACALELTVFPKSDVPRILPDKAVTITPAVAVPKPLNPADTLPMDFPVLIPKPKSVRFSRGTVLWVPKRWTYHLDAPRNQDGKRLERACRDLLTDVKTQTGMPFQQANPAVIVISVGKPPFPDHDEGYTLTIDKEAVRIRSKTPVGAFYGLQTLRQIMLFDVLRRDPHYLPACEIEDYPLLKFRAAHLFVGRNALPFHKKLIERILSRYKLNALVLECEYSQWKTHPEIHAPNSMPLADLKAEVLFAREHFMEPIPLINSLGHSEWMFKNNTHLDLTEDAARPYAYNASDPRVYDFLFDIYGEALDIFKPRFFHIGHDEVKILDGAQFGRYPARPENITKGVTKLFTDDVATIAAWLKKRDIRPMLWGDMLLHESEGEPKPGIPRLTAANAATVEEAKQRRGAITKDAVICDWRYEAGSEQRNGLKVFADAGFETVGSAWYQGENSAGWARQAIQSKAWGTLQTTWAGYDSNEKLLESEFRQFAAFVWAAEYAWSGNDSKPSALGFVPDSGGFLPYDAGVEFVRSYRNRPVRAAWQVEFSDFSNVIWSGDPYGMFFAPIPVYRHEDLTTGYEEPVTRARVRMGSHGLMLRGMETPAHFPTEVTVPLDRTASLLIFAHSTQYGLDTGTHIATYRVTYRDGKTQDIPIRYGREIRAIDDAAPPLSANLSTITLFLAPLRVTLRALLWDNPRPEVPIASITFQAVSPLAGTLLFSVIGCDPAAKEGEKERR